MKTESLVSVIMPVYKGESTIQKTLESLLQQTKKFEELIIIDDASPDHSKEIIKKFLDGKINYRLIIHEKNIGLAKSYNDGISKSIGDLIVTLHQDVILDPNALLKLTESFKDDNVVAAGHISVFPFSSWKDFSFWQKCFFSRFIGKELPGINGQFDCFRKVSLERVGMFNGEIFRSAGEDADIVYKLEKIGKIAYPKAKLIHLQSLDQNFGYCDIIFKQKQHSESRGVLLRRGEIKSAKSFFSMFFREILAIGLIIPYVSFFFAFLIIVYSFWYTGKVFREEFKDPRIIFLPFLNICLLAVSFYYTLKGFVYGRQRI